MAVHNFSFPGGEILARIGASWFVSYAYYQKIDATHLNWNRVSTTRTRISYYQSGSPYHVTWLNEVLGMNPANLNKNTIGLDAQQIKRMAQEILQKNDL